MEALYDLRAEPWIPFRRRSGAVEWGAPWLLTDRLHDDPIVALAAPRPDFNGALHEFLIGLVSVAMQAQDEGEWRVWWKSPPTPAQLREQLMLLPEAFYLNGDGPRFMQDLRVVDFAKADAIPIERLLIDAPGEQSVELNKDLFVKRDRVGVMGAPAAAMALLTLQTYAPAGGQGHLTSMRGGGPLTTLVLPDATEATGAAVPLWNVIWANTETEQQWKNRTSNTRGWNASDLFQWLGQPLTSDSGGTVTPTDAHPMQCYFAAPRRIRLTFGSSARCDVIGSDSTLSVASFKMRPKGSRYDSWFHPLSPYYESSKGGGWLPIHGQPGGVGWREWLTLTLADPDVDKKRPAQAVVHFRQARARHVGDAPVRLRAFGYDMDNMKARDWVEATLPFIAADDENTLRVLRDTANRLANGTQRASGLLAGAVERALFQNPKDAPGDRFPVKAALWAEMEGPFYQVVFGVSVAVPNAADADSACEGFRRALEDGALKCFDEQVNITQLLTPHVRRAVAARYDLGLMLRGFGPGGRKLFEELRLTPPERKAPKAKSPSGGKKSRTRTAERKS